MNESIQLRAKVPPELAGERFDHAAAQLFDSFSRARLQTWIRSGDLRLDGAVRRPRDRVAIGAELALDATLEVVLEAQPEAIPLTILFEDEHLIVLDKPSGLVVHPGAGNRAGTLLNALLAHAPELAQLPRAGIVHRLDRQTTGLMVVARSLLAQHRLVRALAARAVTREYFAICNGALSGGATIDAPIGRHPRQRKLMAVIDSGKPAITHYRIAQRYGHYTALKVNLETGRTHQIRVHLAHRRHPLIGDPVYGGRLRLPPGASPPLIEALRSFPRQALHARRLELLHPASGETMAWESPLPADLVALQVVLAAEDPWPSR